MRLLELKSNGDFSLTKDLISDIPPYAILSHTWGNDDEEVTYKDLTEGSGRMKRGYEKIRFCATQASNDGLRFIWIDTCCIDKSNNAELSEAIISMFRWYRNAAKCYVYLTDVSSTGQDPTAQLWTLAFGKSRWFTRGWTLQELIAPSSVEFFSIEGQPLGSKSTLEQQVHKITGIAVKALQGHALSEFSVAERLSWAESRETKREEDKAYSLLGMFNVHMPPLYGEGAESAFRRLHEEINKCSNSTHDRDLLDHLPYAVEAPFNTYQRQHNPICLPDTRVDVLRDIYNWADGGDGRCIFWLNGLAGTGKSTISRTVARRYLGQLRLGASFFFSRGGGDIGHAGKFVTSIAWQLASSIPSLGQHICNALTQRRDIVSQSLRDQWQQLVLRPLSKLGENGSQSSYVLIIDALDECDNDNDIRIIIQLLAEAQSLKTVRLRVFLTSRPEIPIRYGFTQVRDTEYQGFVLHSILPSIVDHDISVFFKHNLKIIGQEQSLDTYWPGEEIIGRLIQIAGGLFIWAATACRFIHEGKRFAARRLQTILQGSGSAPTAPEKHLDEIYTTVLKQSVGPEYTEEEKEEAYCMLRITLGSIVILLSPLSTSSLSKLLDINKEAINQTLNDLHSVLDVPEEQTQPLRLHHPSFRDYLLSNVRCKDQDLWVDEKKAHQMLADSCIRLMSTVLKRDICGLGSPGVLATNILSSRVERCLPPEVQYACLYWVQHLQRSVMQLHDDDQVHQFLQLHLLHWLEALSLMRNIPVGILAITSLEFNIIPRDCPRLYTLINDIKRFALYFRSAVEEAPLQVYYTALVFAPAGSVVRKQFEDQIPRWIRRLPCVQKDWGALLQTLEGHTSTADTVVFSPNGRQLASASNDRTVRLWDAATGVLLHTLEGHDDLHNTLAFSPNGRQLASTSGDGRVMLWDTATGALLQTLIGHSGLVYALAFSPNGKQLVSASCDSTVRLWDAATGDLLHKLEDHLNAFDVTLDFHIKHVVTFSSDSRQLASILKDCAIGLWDTATGALLAILDSIEATAVVLSPDDRQLASWDRNTVWLWDTTLEGSPQTLKGHSGDIRDVAFSPDGRQLASASNDRTVRLWDTATGALLQTLKGHSKAVFDVAFSPDRSRLASVSDDTTIGIWDAATGALLQILKGTPASINTIAFSPDSKRLASASWDSTVRLWDATIGAPLQLFESHSGCVRAVAFSPDGRQLASASDDRTVRLLDVTNGELLQTLEGHSGSVCAVTFSPDGRQLASVSFDDTRLSGFNAITGAPTEKVTVAFSPDGRQLASTWWYSIVRLWDATTGALLHTLGDKVEGKMGLVSGWEFGWVSGWARTVWLWDAVTGATLQTLMGHSKFVDSVAFSPDGRQLVSGSGDGTVRLWNVATGALLRTIDVAFSRWWTCKDYSDEQYSDEDYLDEDDLDEDYSDEDHSVPAVAFSPDGRHLASALSDRTVRLWDGTTGTPLQMLKFDVVVRTLAFPSDNSYLQTDRGPVSLYPGIALSPPSFSCGVFVKKQWITRDMENFLWLPRDNRPSSMAVYENVVVMGHESGRVSLLEFEEDSAIIGKLNRKKRIAELTDRESFRKRQKVVHSMT